MKKGKKHKKAKKNHASGQAAPAAVIRAPFTAPSTPQVEARSSNRRQGGIDARVETLAHEVIARVADKWTIVVLQVLAEHGVVRFSHLGKLAGGVSQKMLTKTLRQMESDGLVRRTALPIIPPHVEYQLTPLGESLSEAFCGVWAWAEANCDAVEKARAEFQATSSTARGDADTEAKIAGRRRRTE
jgi:DNA-binding HxlR family transcriptional regulator